MQFLDGRSQDAMMNLRWQWHIIVVAAGQVYNFLNDMGTQVLWKILQAMIQMESFCQKREWVDHMFCNVFVDNKLSDGCK